MRWFKGVFTSFRLKLALAFLLVILVILTSVYFLIGHLAEREFRDYVIRGNTNQATGMKESLLDFYGRNTSWKNVEEVFTEEQVLDSRGSGRRSGPGGPSAASGMRNLSLVGSNRRVIASYNEDLVGEKIPESLLDSGLQLDYEGERIGTVLAGPLFSTELGEQEQQFLNSLQRGVLYAGAAGLIIAALLGGLLVRQLTRPLNELTEATERVSEGELDQKVNINSDDEIGTLGKAFNRMSENLKESEEIRKRMIGDIAHELRTPLSVVSGEMEAIREGVYEPSEKKLKEIEDELSLLSRLVEDLRELTLAESGELDLKKDPADLNRLIKKVIGQMESIFREEGVELEFDESGDQPEIRIDADRISQVLSNLLKNSVRHTSEGGKVEILVSEEEKRVLIQVSDNGEGLPEEKLDHVFERFYRAESSRSGRGSGLGLSIAKELVDAHGGDIWVESDEGKGTTIGFSLPK